MWMFDIATVADTTVLTANVAELLQSRMQQMPTDVRLLLQFGACLGLVLRVSVSILGILWQHMGMVELCSLKVWNLTIIRIGMDDKIQRSLDGRLD